MISKEQERILREQAKQTADKYIADPRAKPQRRRSLPEELPRQYRFIPYQPEIPDAVWQQIKAGK